MNRLISTVFVMFFSLILIGCASNGEVRKQDVGVVTGAVSYHCRGHGARERFGLLGIAIEAEKEIISMMVSREQQDTVFEALHRAGEMDVSGNGYVYCTPLEKMAIYIPKDMIDKLEDKK